MQVTGTYDQTHSNLFEIPTELKALLPTKRDPTSLVESADTIKVSEFQLGKVTNLDFQGGMRRTLALDSRYVCFIESDNSIGVISPQDLSLNYTIQNIQSRVFDMSLFETPDFSVLAIVSIDGIVNGYRLQLNEHKNNISVHHFLNHRIEGHIEQPQVMWKDSNKLGVMIKNELTLIEVFVEDANVQEEGTGNQLKPRSFNVLRFEKNVRDFSFSPRYALAYLLFEDNTVRVINSENGFKLREFTPHDDPSATVLNLQCYKNLAKEGPAKGNNQKLKVDKDHDYSLKDVFITISEKFEVKVWDLSEWDNVNKTYYCIETLQLEQNFHRTDMKSKIYAFFDPNRSLLFLANKEDSNKEIEVIALYINEVFQSHQDNYHFLKKSSKFFKASTKFKLDKTDMIDLAALNLYQPKTVSSIHDNLHNIKDPQTDTDVVVSVSSHQQAPETKKEVIFNFLIQTSSYVSLLSVLNKKVQSFLPEVGHVDTNLQKIDANLSTTDKEAEKEKEEESVEEIEDKKEEQQPEEETKDVACLIKKEDSECSEDVLEIKGDEFYEAVKDTKKVESKPQSGQATASKKKKNKKKRGQENTEAAQDDKPRFFVIQRVPPTSEPQSLPNNNTLVVPLLDSKNNASEYKPSKVKSIKESSTISSPEIIESTNSEDAIENRLKAIFDSKLQSLENKVSNIDKYIEKKVNERVAKLESKIVNGLEEKITNVVNRVMEKALDTQFANYYNRTFEIINRSLEKEREGYLVNFTYQEEQRVLSKKTMDDALNQFGQILNGLTQVVTNSQESYNTLENEFKNKKIEFAEISSQIHRIVEREQLFYTKVLNLEKDMQQHATQCHVIAQNLGSVSPQNYAMKPQNATLPPLILPNSHVSENEFNVSEGFKKVVQEICQSVYQLNSQDLQKQNAQLPFLPSPLMKNLNLNIPAATNNFSNVASKSQGNTPKITILSNQRKSIGNVNSNDNTLTPTSFSPSARYIERITKQDLSKTCPPILVQPREPNSSMSEKLSSPAYQNTNGGKEEDATLLLNNLKHMIGLANPYSRNPSQGSLYTFQQQGGNMPNVEGTQQVLTKSSPMNHPNQVEPANFQMALSDIEKLFPENPASFPEGGNSGNIISSNLGNGGSKFDDELKEEEEEDDDDEEEGGMDRPPGLTYDDERQDYLENLLPKDLLHEDN